MPKVGNKHFSYDQSGHDKAMKEAQRTGLPIDNEDKNYAQFAGGGSVMKPKMYGKSGSVMKPKMYGKSGSVRGYGKARAPKGKK